LFHFFWRSKRNENHIKKEGYPFETPSLTLGPFSFRAANEPNCRKVVSSAKPNEQKKFKTIEKIKILVTWIWGNAPLQNSK